MTRSSGSGSCPRRSGSGGSRRPCSSGRRCPRRSLMIRGCWCCGPGWPRGHRRTKPTASCRASNRRPHRYQRRNRDRCCRRSLRSVWSGAIRPEPSVSGRRFSRPPRMISRHTSPSLNWRASNATSRKRPVRRTRSAASAGSTVPTAALLRRPSCCWRWRWADRSRPRPAMAVGRRSGSSARKTWHGSTGRGICSWRRSMKGRVGPCCSGCSPIWNF